MARGRSLPAALALAAVLTCAREAVPPELVGQWKSDDPRYVDRSLAIGTDISDSSSDGLDTVFLVAAALGFVGTLASLALLWRWTERRRRAGAAGPA